MSSGLEFSAEAALRHADEVSGLSAEMAQARSAAGQVAMNTQAYGQLCQFLPALLSPLFADAAEVMNGAVEALEETALNLRETATGMTATDDRSRHGVIAAGGPGIDLPL